MVLETPLIEGFVKWLHALSAQASHRVSQFITADTRLRTPEVEGTGPEAIAAIYAGLFDDGAKVIIRVLNGTASPDGHMVYLRWDRLIISKTGQKQALSGITEVMIGTNGKIASLTEYWDSVPTPLKKRSWLAKLCDR